jgi:acetolactate synthase I/III small subunit
MNVDNPIRKHTISVLVENQPGVLARVVGLISGRGFNIESLNVASTHDPCVSRMTLVVPGGDRVVEQITNQFHKLVDVREVADLTRESFLNRECILIKVAAKEANRADLIDLANVWGGRIVSVDDNAVIVELVGDQSAVVNFIKLMTPFQISDISRSGVIAMSRRTVSNPDLNSTGDMISP